MSVSVMLRGMPEKLISVALPTCLTSTGGSSPATSLRRNAQLTYFAHPWMARDLENPITHGALMGLGLSKKIGCSPCIDLIGPENSPCRERPDSERCWKPIRVWRNATHRDWSMTLPTSH